MSKGRILIIDDDNFLRKVYQAELKEKGYEVSLAVDGVDGLEKIDQIDPDVIILDLIMPKKSGFEVLSDIQRAGEVTAPIIVLSNLAQSDDQKRALDLGAVEYLVKDNTTLDIIADKIEQHIQTRSAKARPKPVTTQTTTSGTTGAQSTGKNKPTQQTSAGPSAKVGEPAHRGHNFCPTCGYKLRTNAKFCPDCGMRL